MPFNGYLCYIYVIYGSFLIKLLVWYFKLYIIIPGYPILS